MKSFITILLLTGASIMLAQNPAIQWQNTIGGSAADFLQSIEPTPDGGYILGGFSSSNISGDKTENSNGGDDIWIIKIDDTGNIQWQNTIGGSGDDRGYSTKPTSDGGYIVIGTSDSNISGDKTENSRGELDYWILKLDDSGEIMWQRTYGGAGIEFYAFGEQTADGGYIVGGESVSDVSGDKTDPSNGLRDFWVLKLDSSGNITWQESIGGSMVDDLLMIKQTTDEGYIIGGHSASPVSGDKSEPNVGMLDFWIVKLNPDGSIQWENTIGGSQNDLVRDIIETADGGYLVGGYSRSGISGEKTEPAQGEFDYWIIKLDSSGTIVWQNTIGGIGQDYTRDVIQLSNGTYLISGWSNTDVSGDKTAPSQGGYDFWLVQLDNSGNIINQNSIGGTADESGTYLLATPDGKFVFACSSDSNTSGDKGDDNEGLDDYWVFKTGPEILGTPESDISAEISLFPNPTSGNLNINFVKTYSEVSLKVTNVLGQIISSEKFLDKKTINYTIAGGPGVYFITVSISEKNTKTFKVIKN